MPAHQPYSNRGEPARGSSLQTIKTQQRAREEEEKIKQRRKKGIVVMMLAFLQEQGYIRSLEALQLESQVSFAKFVPADNMDLNTIFSEYEDYQEFRFGRTPKFFRGIEAGDVVHQDTTLSLAGEQEKRRPPPAGPTGASASGCSTPPDGPQPPQAPLANGGRPQVGKPASGGGFTFKNPQDGEVVGVTDGVGAVQGKTIKLRRAGEETLPSTDDESHGFMGRQLKPMPRYPTAELNELAMTIQRDILEANPNVMWNDIAELDNAKMLLKEAVVMPVKYPQLFAGIMRPWKGILLFGPPGTGKTMLAKALATECRTTFFNISASSIVSKWRGDSEKLVRMLFELAVHYAPSTIFIDELDSLMSARASDGSEHEGSRRMKTELLVQMDGLQKTHNGDVFVLAASNVPWDLDGAMLRRLEKRVLVGLPSATARQQLFRSLLKHVEPSFDFDRVAQETEGHSGADIDIVCREATMRSIRVLIKRLETEKELPNTPLHRPLVSTQDVMASIQCTRSSGHSMGGVKKYEEWERSFGSGMSL